MVAVLSVAVVAAFTWPLVAHLNHAAEDPFDPRFQAWTLDWVQHAIRHPSHLYDANIFAPNRNTLAYSDALVGLAVPLLPLRWAGLTPIGVFNVAILAGFALSSTAGYFFGWVVTRSRTVAAVVAGAFAFGEFGTYESVHVQTVFRPGVALAAAAAWHLADRGEHGEPPWWAAAALAAAVAWQCSVSFYSGAYAFVAAFVVLAVRARQLRGRAVAAALVAMGASAAAALLLAVPYLSAHAAVPGFHWTLADLRLEGADFSRVDSRVAIWGGVLGARGQWPQFPPPLFPGVTILAFGAYGAVAAWRSHRRAVVAGVALFAVGAIAALGTADRGWRRLLPYRAVFALAPGGQALRATFRAWMIGLLGLGVLAGLGAEHAGRWLAGRWLARSRRQVAGTSLLTGVVAALVTAGILAEGYRSWSGVTPIGVHPVDRVLARLPGRGGVLYWPVSTADVEGYVAILSEADDVYRTTAHHRPTPNGYSGFFPPSYAAMAGAVRGLPAEPSLAYLRRIGVSYVVAVSGRPGDPLGDPVTARPLTFVGRFGPDLLYAVPP